MTKDAQVILDEIDETWKDETYGPGGFAGVYIKMFSSGKKVDLRFLRVDFLTRVDQTLAVKKVRTFLSVSPIPRPIKIPAPTNSPPIYDEGYRRPAILQNREFTMLSNGLSVTGISGYLGAHIVEQLVRQGLRVRGTVRSAKLAATKDAFKIYGKAVEVVAVDDLIEASYAVALQGVDAVIHQASPMPGREATAEEALDAAIEGSLNILRQAEQAGIKKFSYCSSIITFTLDISGDRPYLRDDEWTAVTREDVANAKERNLHNRTLIYAAEKTLAERAVWEFVDQHPHIELTSINAGYFLGPFPPAYKTPFNTPESFSPNVNFTSMGYFFSVLHAQGPPPPDSFVDVRDVARALVLGLTASPASRVGRKRILLGSDARPQPSEVIALINQQRPELARRINEEYKAARGNLKHFIDNKRAKEVLGLVPIPWQKTVLDAVDALVKLEDEWRASGKLVDY
ncbi:hypothetical protein EIP91_001386 [Steccherinum ochraceum]|uniref:NAD-dependent epimerase/dehydratase domain-containing protein n=1 Tax=Steccherinum ochraceum TaxID=92696 RepID=A0A4R0RKE0_9APHY|nr:hypothetical protein EIP91_001386 [Steccherinum ochraceum]